MALSRALISRGWTISKSPGDGHCLLHSVLSSWRNQLPHKPPKDLDLEHIKAHVYIETVQNPGDYAPFLSQGSNLQLFKGLSQYLLHRKYNQEFGDLVPVIISNSFNIGLDIVNQTDHNIIQEISVAPRSTYTESLVIHRHRDHFNGIHISNPYQNTTQYTGEYLKQPRPNASHISRRTRKILFKYNIWKPRSDLVTSDPSDTDVHPAALPARSRSSVPPEGMGYMQCESTNNNTLTSGGSCIPMTSDSSDTGVALEFMIDISSLYLH